MYRPSARAARRAHVRRDRQGLVVHPHPLRCVLGEVTVLGQHHGHRLAGERDLFLHERVGQREVADRGTGHQQRHRSFAQCRRKVVEGEHRVHARHAAGRVTVDGADAGMGVRASHERRVQDAVHAQIVDEAAFATHQRGILDALDRRADVAGHAHTSPGIPAAGVATPVMPRLPAATPRCAPRTVIRAVPGGSSRRRARRARFPCIRCSGTGCRRWRGAPRPRSDPGSHAETRSG